MSLHTYYLKSAIYPTMFVIFSSIVFAIIDTNNYKSEWLTGDAVMYYLMIFGLFYCLILCILSLTIYLNRLKVIRNNIVLNLLSWFLLPIGFIFFMVLSQIQSVIKYEESAKDLFYAIILNVPFLVGLIWSYISFRTQLKKHAFK